MLFINNEAKFVQGLKNAKRVMIEAQFYQEGSRVMEFDVSGFEWSAPAPAKKKG